MLVAALAAVTLLPHQADLPKWTYEIDFATTKTLVDRRATVKGNYKTVPPSFTIAEAFEGVSAFSDMTFKLGDKLNKEFIEAALKTPVEDEPTAFDYRAYIPGLRSASTTATVGSDGRVREHKYVGKCFPEDAEDSFAWVEEVLIERLGKPNRAAREEKEKNVYAIWNWSDGSELIHFIHFGEEHYCIEYLGLSLPEKETGGSARLVARTVTRDLSLFRSAAGRLHR